MIEKDTFINQLKDIFPLFGKTVCIQQDTSYRLYFDKWEKEKILDKTSKK